MKKLRIIVSGYIGLYPSGGVTWDYIQYPLGFYLLGHDVYYFEDTHQYPVYQNDKSKWDDCSACVDYLRKAMESFGLAKRWAYRDVATGKWFGLSNEKVEEIFKTADIFINVSSATHIYLPKYADIPVRVLIDSDPMFTQVQYWRDDNEEESIEGISTLFNWYTHLFSFGENIGKDDCIIPTYNFNWKTTRQPICLQEWANHKPDRINNAFTTIMNWSGRSAMKYKNESWGQKDVEFLKFKNIPCLFPSHPFEVIISFATHAQDSFDKQDIEKHGWKLFGVDDKIGSPGHYRNFISSSTGEFSVAKETYVKSNSGWFSCRSACYLAAGKPVIAQETQWSKYIPSGKGLFAFDNEETALDALRKISWDIHTHSKAAIEIAKEFFDSNRVLNELLNQL